MAEYGFYASNDFGSVTITSTYKVMVFSERGTFNITSRYTDRPGSGLVTFAKPILTLEPPQVFLRHVSGVHSTLGLYVTMLGSSGGWTGFLITSAVRGGNQLQSYLVEYVACKYADAPSAEMYGRNIWDANGRIVFSSSDRVVRFNKFTKNWTKSQGVNVDEYFSGLTIDADDYISVTSFDRGVEWFAGGARYAGVTIWDFNAPTLTIFCDKQTGGGYSYPYGTDGTSFSIPVCKFPISKYYN
ncbi:hypothetical protein HFV04_021350 [Pseudomonas sp. BIGb0427]|uniref:hypothetical protein n=1 Tax=unclassified Pseudomonas TaxID=196821 RepID=UPI0018A6F28F|nr:MULTISPECIES: hypothetical protein [unclassified Pseudomonas]QPG62051.1 hypothetical protein HFV04_021350 [Pseudomonas sp. BIGb0427]UVM64408.1 hypothetical protein LOY34_13705 [Pseudomonas sp. B21-009]